MEDSVLLKHLDRVVFGWNSAYLFKDHDHGRTDEKIGGKKVTWDFIRDELAHEIDIDQSDSEEGGSCCSIF